MKEKELEVLRNGVENMNILKCENGHFYDGDKYDRCPHCGNTAYGNGKNETIGIDDPKPGKKERTDIGPIDIDPGTPPTIGEFAFKGRSPVVGWLVCIKGSDYGMGFPLKAGKNFIGRSRDMDVVLAADQTVSRERHGIIIYEPHSRMFIAQPGESRELFYLNDEVVLNNEKLKAYDILAFGNSKLMLVPCCNEHFSWDELEKENIQEK